MHLNIFMQNRYLQIFDNQLDLKIKTEIEKKTPTSVKWSFYTYKHSVQQTKIPFWAALLPLLVDLKNKYKEDAIPKLYMKPYGLCIFWKLRR